MDELRHIENAFTILSERGERSFINDTLNGLLDALEANVTEIERLKVAEGEAMLVVEQQDLDLKRREAVVAAAQKYLRIGDSCGPAAKEALREALVALDNKP